MSTGQKEDSWLGLFAHLCGWSLARDMAICSLFFCPWWQRESVWQDCAPLFYNWICMHHLQCMSPIKKDKSDKSQTLLGDGEIMLEFGIGSFYAELFLQHAPCCMIHDSLSLKEEVTSAFWSWSLSCKTDYHVMLLLSWQTRAVYACIFIAAWFNACRCRLRCWKSLWGTIQMRNCHCRKHLHVWSRLNS